MENFFRKKKKKNNGEEMEVKVLHLSTDDTDIEACFYHNFKSMPVVGG